MGLVQRPIHLRTTSFHIATGLHLRSQRLNRHVISEGGRAQLEDVNKHESQLCKLLSSMIIEDAKHALDRKSDGVKYSWRTDFYTNHQMPNSSVGRCFGFFLPSAASNTCWRAALRSILRDKIIANVLIQGTMFRVMGEPMSTAP